MFHSKSVELSELFVDHIASHAIAVDCGITTSRIVVVVEKDQRNSIRYVCVENKFLLGILEDTKEMKISFEKIFLTGPNQSWAKSVIKSVFDMEPILIDENKALSNGYDLISNYLNISDIEYKTDDLSEIAERYKVDENNPMIKQFQKSNEIKGGNIEEEIPDKINYPAIFITVGSFTRYFLSKKGQPLQLLFTMFYGRQNFGGLSKCLADINNFPDIIDKANKGDRENTDTQCWEVFSENEKSPYGKLPPNAPIFPFGKGADQNRGKESFKEEDLLAALSNLFLNSALSLAVQFCKIHKIKTIYICGDMLTNPVFGKIIYLTSTRLFGYVTVKLITSDFLMPLGLLKK